MPNITPDIEAFARIKVIGVGGSGKNAVNHMINSKVKGVDFISINTDAQDLHHSLAKKRIHIGKNLTRGLGTGMNPEMGKRAIEETKEEVQEALKGADMIFVACGLGGGTGSGASPVVARTAKELGALTVAVVTKPFFFEGQQRSKISDVALEELRKEVDAIIVIPNDRLLSTIDKNTTVKNAFSMCDEILRQAFEGISDLITTPGLIYIDFADPAFSITVLISAKSMLMSPGVVIKSEIPSTACRSISSHIEKAFFTVVFLSIVERRRSLGITIIASTSFLSSSSATSEIFERCCPSKKKGFVTTATVSAPSSFAVRATTGLAPLPVPPPSPHATNIISAPFSASCTSSFVSSIALLPISGFMPVPSPRVRFLPI
jgi:cell division protein FtsZ